MPPMPSPRAPSQPTPPLQLPSADPATNGAASRSFPSARPWPKPSGHPSSTPSSASPATPGCAVPPPACGINAARSPATSPPPPACKPAHGPTSSEATEASKTATTTSATSQPTRIASVFDVIPASPPARHQWARLRHQFGSKHTNNARNGILRLLDLRGRKQLGSLCCDVAQCPDESITD